MIICFILKQNHNTILLKSMNLLYTIFGDGKDLNRLQKTNTNYYA